MTPRPDVRTAQTHPIGIRTARYDKGLADRLGTLTPITEAEAATVRRLLATNTLADMLADMLGVTTC